MSKVITALFEKVSNADEALYHLAEAGYTKDDISVITGKQNIEVSNDAAKGIVDATTTGGVVGGIAGLLVGLTAFAIPGLGALFIAGPIATALGLSGVTAATATGAVTGALVGGLMGALKELGVDEVQAKIIEDRVKNGDTLLVINPSDEDVPTIKQILTAHDGKHIYEVELIKI